jgi:hypothetical protein
MNIVGKRIETAIKHLMEKDYENALIQICIAIDATAKKKWKNNKPGKRIKLFIKEYETLIYQFASSGHLKLARGGKISIGNELAEVLYKNIRCVLLHGDSISDHIIIEEKYTIGIIKGKIIINIGMIIGFLLSTVVDSVNQYERCDFSYVIDIAGVNIDVNQIWGNINKLEQIIKYKKIL